MESKTQIIIKVKGSTSPRACASSVAKHLKSGAKIKLMSIGVPSNYQAIKALIILRGFLASAALDLPQIKPSFVDVPIDGRVKSVVCWDIG